MKKMFFIIAVAAIAGLGFYIYKLTTYTYVTAKFSELRPIHQKLHVYYKGIVVGRAKEPKHSDDFNHTMIKLVLYPKSLMLPDNTLVLLKKEKIDNKEQDFLELVYPQKPSEKMIVNGAILEGKATVDIDSFLSNQSSDDLETIKNNLAESTENLNNALEGLNVVFVSLNDILKENQNNLSVASGNLSKATGNIDAMTEKINNAMEQKQLNNTFSSIEKSAGNLAVISDNLEGTTNNVNSTLYQVNGLATNANVISCGVRKTLGKPFGGLRLLFGKVIKE